MSFLPSLTYTHIVIFKAGIDEHGQPYNVSFLESRVYFLEGDPFTVIVPVSCTCLIGPVCCNCTLYLKKAGLASRNIVHLQKIIVLASASIFFTVMSHSRFESSNYLIAIKPCRCFLSTKLKLEQQF